MIGRRRKYAFLAIALVLVAIVWTSMSFYEKATRRYPDGSPAWVVIPQRSTQEAIHDSLRVNLGSAYGDAVNEIWHFIKGHPSKAAGAYRIEPGDKVIDIARRLKTGSQTPINLTYNNQRLLTDLASAIAGHFNFSAEDFLEACDSILPSRGFDKPNFIGAFLPDSYQFYWTASPAKVVNRLADYYDSFWNETRRQQAAKLNLTPQQVVILASIVDEETASADEKGTVARLYLNRLKKKMKLQADPTVKYAVGDFTLRRILNSHLATNSPYNTYIIDGLPPGPIRMPEKSTIDAVLNAPANNYLYMCAKEDFSGRHNFAETLETHNANAARYRAALNRLNIK